MTVTGSPEPSIAARATATASVRVGDQRRPGAGLQHLRHRAAHVEVDQRRPGRGRHRRRLAHHLGIGAEQLDRDRALVGMDAQHLLDRAPVAVGDREARDHLGDRQPGAVAVRLQADEPVADPGQRREQDAVGELDVGDPERGRSAAAGVTSCSSQISRRPVSVSRSSTSSIVSQNGTIACARPPVAITVGSPPSSASIRRAIPSISPANPKITPGLDRAAGRPADRGLGLVELDPPDPGAALGQRGQRDLDPGCDRAAQVLAVGGDRVEVDPGAEVDDHAGVAEAVVGGDGVDEPVGADLVGVVDPDRHPGLHPGADRQAGRVEVARRHRLVLAAERRHDRRDADRVDLAALDPAQREQARRSARRSRRRSRRRRSESASARPARRPGRRPGGSACCRRRSRAASALIMPGG